MEITPTRLLGLRTTFSRAYQAGYDATETWHPEIATTIPSSTSQNDYGWVSKIPGMKEWLSERTIENLISSSYVIKNKLWEDTVGVAKTDIDDDNLGMYTSVIMPGLGEAVKKAPDLLLRDLIEAGATSAVTCFNGQPFFSASHPVNPFDSSLGTQANLFTSSALTQTTFDAGRVAMRKFKGEDGNPMGGAPDILMVPPALEITALKIVKAQTIFTSTASTNAAAPENVTRGMARVVVNDDLTSDTTWYLINARRAIKPFVLQMREAATFQALTSPNDPNVFHNAKYLYGASGRWNVGVSLPGLAARFTA